MDTHLSKVAAAREDAEHFPCKELSGAKATINGIFNHGKQESKPVQSLVERIVRQQDTYGYKSLDRPCADSPGAGSGEDLVCCVGSRKVEQWPRGSKSRKVAPGLS